MSSTKRDRNILLMQISDKLYDSKDNTMHFWLQRCYDLFIYKYLYLKINIGASVKAVFHWVEFSARNKNFLSFDVHSLLIGL